MTTGVGLAALLPGVADWPLLWLFVAAHLLGDFLLQTAWIVENKGRWPVLLLHVGIVLVAHVVVLLPFLSAPVLLAAAAVAVAHLAIDFLKLRWRPGGRGALRPFLLDQAAHLGAGVLAAGALSTWASPAGHVALGSVEGWTTVAVTAGVFAFTWTGGDAIVRGTLAAVGGSLEEEQNGPGDGVPGSGRTIGVLERTIALILILLGQWGALLLLVAVKSIARFEALKQRHFAEYYLIGTLASLLVAILSGLLLGTAVRVIP